MKRKNILELEGTEYIVTTNDIGATDYEVKKNGKKLDDVVAVVRLGGLDKGGD